jgi:leucyl aminopeptidase
MLQITNNSTLRTQIVLFPETNFTYLTFLDDVEKKVLSEKIKTGLKTIPFTHKTKIYILCPIANIVDKNTFYENLRLDGNNLYKLLMEYKEEKAAFISYGDLDTKVIKSFLLGLNLSNYQFNKYLKNKKSFNLTIQLSTKILNKESIDEINVLCDATKTTKDLVNEPLSYLTAVQYSKEIQRIGKQAGFSVTVWNQKKIEQEKMGGLIAVNKGSSAPATFNILEYKPIKPKNKQPLVLVGKGVVFDTGGISIKPSNGLAAMKCDMAGSALVVGAMQAIAIAKLPYHIIGLIPAVENRPGYEATCPGDIITMYDGTTVEVLDTDAEGRLILADAVHYAKRLKPELVLDFATLTGSAMRAIGKEAAVVMGTCSKEIKKKIKKAANRTGERIVEFPLWNEYGEYMKSDVADLKNLGPAEAGAITAGKFLQHFTDYPWMHFDVAGPAFVNTSYNYRGKWATAYGVRLLFKFVKNISKDVNKKRETKSRNNAG